MTNVPHEDLEAGSEESVIEAAARRIARPKRAPADSFVLHAPLELLARIALLPRVARDARDAARDRVAWLGRTYAEAGDELPEPPRPAFGSPEEAAARLSAAIDAGELDDVDACAAWLADLLPADALARTLADDVVPRLGAAAHGSIFLWWLPRLAPDRRVVARGLRGLARDLAREGTWRLGWHASRARDVAPAGDLLERLLAPPSPGDPGSDFIYPTMALVERSGLARDLLDAPTRGLDVGRAARDLSRVAAWSMLQDDPASAPYGWTHCLTMPQATLGIAALCRDPDAAVAVAATYVLGFRATLGRVRLDPGLRPPTPVAREPLADVIAGGSPLEAAASAWHAPDESVPRLVTALATRAALHPDAHLAKYTVACLDAARADPQARHVHLAAAAYLSAWWAGRDAAPAASPHAEVSG